RFEDVEISELQVTKEKGDTLVEFELRLANRDENSYLEELLNDTLHNWYITGLKFEASGVTFENWTAKDECKVCSEGGAGHFIIQGECVQGEQCSCNGVKTTKESNDCVKYCSAEVIESDPQEYQFIGLLLDEEMSAPSLIPSTDMIQLTLTLKMTAAKGAVEKRQSTSTTVLFRTMFTRTIMLNLHNRKS
ncbi:unnamed protein product, partial [Porites lobata]